MIVSCKPRLEALENRLTMNASALAAEIPQQRSADPLPVLLVIADQRDFYMKPQSSTGRITGIAVDPSDAGDDVWVEGKIITAENFDGSTPLPSVTDLIVDRFDGAAAAQFDSEYKYIAIRRTAVLGADTFDSRPGTGVLRSMDGGNTW